MLWTNYPAETRVTTGTAGDALPVVDLCALLPMAAEQAGLPLSPYYRYLLAMRQEVSGWTNLDGVLLPDGSVAAMAQAPRPMRGCPATICWSITP